MTGLFLKALKSTAQDALPIGRIGVLDNCYLPSDVKSGSSRINCFLRTDVLSHLYRVAKFGLDSIKK